MTNSLSNPFADLFQALSVPGGERDLLEQLQAELAGKPGEAPEDAVDSDSEEDEQENLDDLSPVPAQVTLQRFTTDLLIEVDMPGVRRGDVTVTMTKDGLRVRGLRRPLGKYPDCEVLADTIARGPYEALIKLDSPVSPDSLNAVLVDGVLEVNIQDVFKLEQPEFEVPVEDI